MWIFALGGLSFVLESVLSEMGQNKAASMVKLAGYAVTLALVMNLVWEVVSNARVMVGTWH